MARAKTTTRRLSRSQKAGVVFPMARIHRFLKARFGRNLRVSWGAAAYCTAVLEYMSAEVLEIAGNVARDFKQKRLSPRHILVSMLGDVELNRFLNEQRVVIPSGGVLPHLRAELLPKGRKATAPRATAPVAKATSPKRKAVGTRKAATKKAVPVAAAKGKRAAAAAAATTTARRKQQGITILNERVLINGQRLCVVSGDIVDVSCDAIVNPSSSNFGLSGQVGSRLQQVGGDEFQANVDALQKSRARGLPTADAAMCEGVGFAAEHVIHVNGPSWGGDAATAIPQLEKSVANCLQLADSSKLVSVCFPSIGSGVGGFPKQTAAQTILRALSNYFKTTPKSTLTKVIFNLYDQESIDIYVNELKRLQE